MKEYVENITEYVKNMKEYVNILDLTLQYVYGSWDLEKFRAPPSYSLWDLEKFRILPLHVGFGTWKNLDLHPYIYIYGDRLWDPFLRLQHVGEVSLFCLLHISSKLFLSIYSSKPQKCECLGR